MCQKIPLFVLLFTGYLCNNIGVAGETTVSSHTSLPVPEVTDTPEPETTPHGSDNIRERMSTLLVAGIIVSVMLLIIFVIISVWCARTRSKRTSVEMNPARSGERGVSVGRHSTHEQPAF